MTTLGLARWYVDADTLGLAHVLIRARPDVTFAGDDGTRHTARWTLPPCPVQQTSARDTEWIPKVAAADMAIISRDRAISRRRAEKDAILAAPPVNPWSSASCSAPFIAEDLPPDSFEDHTTVTKLGVSGGSVHQFVDTNVDEDHHCLSTVDLCARKAVRRRVRTLLTASGAVTFLGDLRAASLRRIRARHVVQRATMGT